MTRRTLVVALILWGWLAAPLLAQEYTDDSEPGQDSYWYGQFTFGSIAEGLLYRNKGFAFGHRRESGHLAVDLQLFSVQFESRSPDLHSIGGVYTSVTAGSVLTGQALLVLQPRAPQSLYVGGGVGLTGISFGQSGDLDDEWHGRGVQGRGTVGYAFRRSPADLRWHVEAGLTTPLRAVHRSTRRGAPEGTRRIYPWSIALGVGW